ncbi:TetR family transcriptional regulator [Actinoalloteichus sp. AHMU CJ021]|uniref:Transcriptional regulator, TetR family n=1 Tax=Actinoalloteichus caeruleus DSM 43889 TaxID=1120930 RepID=A0ABT1JMX5_ACTCY|nr:TetR family transcriptional regulator [Actinoalloteichus caeruleus]AUS78861.1 TetR family transcriptional regulator [Actinoalloteichus sp. AHMU CJ021]MCP2333056.1 transcriptional regulator, TetR family [Actinoalloteichus caeruleus DSM 43889]
MTEAPDPHHAAPPDRRRRRAQRTRAGIEAAALRLFREHGFEATTIAQIADAADIAPRTFFRYFPSKEAVLFGDPAWPAQMLRESISRRPADEHPMRSLAWALGELDDVMQEERAQHLLRCELLAEVDEVRYAQHIVSSNWMRELTALIAERLGADPHTDPRPQAWAMALAGTVSVSLQAWLARPEGPLPSALLAEVLHTTIDGLSETARGLPAPAPA